MGCSRPEWFRGPEVSADPPRGRNAESADYPDTRSLEKLHAVCYFRDPPTMSAIWNLHCLYSLDPSSPGFVRRLFSLFRYDEEERYLSRLQGSELTRLLDFLDRVCTLSRPSVQLRNEFCRLSAPYLPTTIFLYNVCANYKPSALTTPPYHSHISHPVRSSEWVITQSPLVISPIFGKAPIVTTESLSST